MKHYKKEPVIFRSCNTPDRPLVYVLRGENGDMLVDTAYRLSVHNIDRWLRKSGYDIKWIFLTHGHFDHVCNARFFREKYGAKIILHEKDEELFRCRRFPELFPSSPSAKAITAAANAIMRRSKVPPCDLDYLLTDDDTDFLRKLGFDADVVMLPGHTKGSMGILQGRVLYAGDACSAVNGDYYTAFFGEDVPEIYRTEKKIFALNPLIIAPGHGRLVVNARAFPKK